MTNKLFAEIEKRLLTECARNRDAKMKEATAYANGFEEGMHKALEAFSAAEPNSPAAQSTPLTNLDRIRAMSAEEMANQISSLNLACEFCPVDTPCFAQKQGGSECRQHIVEGSTAPQRRTAMRERKRVAERKIYLSQADNRGLEVAWKTA